MVETNFRSSEPIRRCPVRGAGLRRRSTRGLVSAVRIAILAAAVLAVGRCASAPPPPPAQPAAVKSVPPEALAGNWLFAVKMGGRTIEGSLHFSVVRGVLAGTWTSSDGREFELEHVAIDGDGVSWESEGPAGRMRASGKIDGSSMKGTMKRAGRSSNGSGASGSGQAGSGQTTPPPNGEPGDTPSGSGDTSGGGRSGGRGRGSGRGGRGRGGSTGGAVTWTAFKSNVPVEAPGGSPPPPATPTPGPA